MRIKVIIVSLLMILAATSAQAQITIGGNVYGGGNEGDVGGNTTVTVRAGALNEVYGGARIADVGGRAFVNVDGEHASDNIFINTVYGGNDIAGTVGTSENLPLKTDTSDGLTEVGTEDGKNAIDNTWNAFIRTSPTPSTASLVVGRLFGGGNGDYTYTSNSEVEGTYDITVGDKTYQKIKKPELGKTYLEILGGCIAHLYGGGDNVTVTKNTTICIDNNSPVLTQTNVWPASPTPENLAELAQKVELSTFQSNLTSYDFNFARVFGGNNKAEMTIRPKWNLKKGIIRDLYSGGNQGAMTSPEGLLLNIESNSNIVVENLYGGCRMADVCPKVNGVYIPTTNSLEGYHFPVGFAARVIIRGGDVNNVYGGNDISGKVYGGNAVGISTSVRGDVYGGGNGSYAYTDKPTLGQQEMYKDFYYTIPDGMSSVEALNATRPNAEQVSIHVEGNETKPTIIHGGIYCGGNSATIMSSMEQPKVELKIGSYVIADAVFLGNNGANMIKQDILEYYADTDYSSLDLTDPETFAAYMDGAAMRLMPSVVFDKIANGDGKDYKEYTSYFGSLFCGGNVGSMKVPGKTTINFDKPFYVFNKVVGGCNNANIYASGLNAEYLGGLLENPAPAPDGSPEGTIGDKLELNLAGVMIRPMRWAVQRNTDYSIVVDAQEQVTYLTNDKGNHYLEWNTVSASTGKEMAPVTDDALAFDATKDLDRRLKGGNIYGGCYNSGHVNGNVVININETLVERDKVFDVASDEGETLYENVERGTYQITKRNSGVILSQQGMDVLGSALNVFGGGYGAESEIWGSSTINLNKGYTFQIFGGGEAGAIGNGNYNNDTHKIEYTFNPKYSTYINLNGEASLPGVARGVAGDSPDMAECEFIYGGGFEGVIAGDIHINLGNGRIFNSFAGSCNADILGHTETYVGQNGFPWIRDHIYGGNDLGGSIRGYADFSGRIRNEVKDLVADAYKAQVENATSYMEYNQGRVRNILGGCFGDYNYSLDEFSVKESADDENYKVANKPYLHNAFINFRPNTNANNSVEKIFGAGEGYPGDRDGDKSQDHSYVLIDIPDNVEKFGNTEVFGAGAYNGLGMRTVIAPQVEPERDKYENDEDYNEACEAYEAYLVSLNEVSAIIDLMRGKIGAAYGGSYEEGITRRTVVNVPAKGASKSTIKINNIFGGAYGMKILPPCDVYEANVNYQSGDARVNGAIYGGNNNVRRTLYGKVNIFAPVLKENGYSGYVYGAGRGRYTWSEYTEVNLERGASVWEVYGGGELGNVLNAESVQKYLQLYSTQPADMVANEDPDDWGDPDKWVDGTVGGTLKDDLKPEWKKAWMAAWTIDGYYNPVGDFTRYVGNEYTNLLNPLVTVAEMDDRDLSGFSNDQKTRTFQRYNTNVIIKEGATVGNYAYGGGYGDATIPLTGGVYGSSYIALLGGTVGKDVYAAGTTGSVCDIFGAGKPGESNSMGFIASANAYIKGGTVRNVYGGGWEGSVGYHVGGLSDSDTGDIPGETHVVIGIRKDQATLPEGYGFLKGVPAIQRNAFGGGEGGAVYGTTHVSLNNGYIGYEHFNAKPTTHTDLTYVQDGSDYYQEKIHDETWSDDTHPKGSPNYRLEDCGNVYGGGYDDNSNVDNSYVSIWGGLIRNSVYGGGEIATVGRGSTKEEGAMRTLNEVYHSGTTHIEMYNGHVLRDVYGGGKGFNLLGFGHKADQERRYTDGYVFGQTAVYIYGGEIGTVAGIAEGYGNVFGGGNIGYVYSPGYYDTDSRKTSTGSPGHTYYYKNGILTEDCKVVVSPRLQIKKGGSNVTYDNITYKPFDYVPTDYLNTLPKKEKGVEDWPTEWQNFITKDGENDRGVMIHNAVFAGGNVSSNSDQTYANATTVYGNTTATLNDVYHRDFITVGTEHTGGLYGGGNLSMVDGYRELNITNYGTDFYRLDSRIELDDYRKLSNRERAYFKLQYVCVSNITINETPYTTSSQPIDEDVYQKYIEAATEETTPKKSEIEAAFTPYGFCSIYAGRLLNTIQRADFCGVFGSRLVLQGAKDRVADVGDATVYTINRVGELSLNLQRSVINCDSGDDAVHGNYFGIYSVVNRLGNLTSDVRFDDKTNHPYRDKDGVKVNGKSYLDFKSSDPTSSNRNIGSSYNQVALASGVFLEMTTEASTEQHKEYGYITGVVELDLINVKRDLVGGGFVYAKNVHGVPTYDPSIKNKILSEYNSKSENEACTYKQYSYTGTLQTYETSGNFIHPEKRIVDDCYPTNNAYDSQKSPYSEAHYWYVKGDVYIYDVNVSAYTGSANAYTKEVKIPLTITAASHGKLQLMNVKPSLYAYNTLNDNDQVVKIGTKEGNKEYDKVFVNGESESYELNDVITWWDWHNLKPSEQSLFRKVTYVNCMTCTIDEKEYETGTYVMDEDAFTSFKTKTHTFKDANGQDIRDRNGNKAGVDYIFRSSNNIGHNTGYVLTFDMDSPKIWDNWYSPETGATTYTVNENGEVTTNRKQTEQTGYREGPTFKTSSNGVYGHRQYNKGEIITEETKNHHARKTTSDPNDPEAVVDRAYVATQSVTYTYNKTVKTVNTGTAISMEEYNDLDDTTKQAFGEAFVCINTVKLDDQNYLLLNDLLTQGQINNLTGTSYPSKAAEITAAMTPAYIITSPGYYGGKQYTGGTNYSAISAWCSLSRADRDNFTYNHDAFDVLSDPNYLDFYDSSAEHIKTIAQAYMSPYSDQVDVEYDAVFQPEAYGRDHKTEGGDPITTLDYDDDESVSASNPRISSTVFETKIKNDQRHYTRVVIANAGDKAYIAKENFDYEGIPYGKGQVIEDVDVYTNNTSKVDEVTFTSAGIQYYCYENYTNASGASISKGQILTPVDYSKLTNDQKYFIIQGKEPTGTTTLYVSSESDINDVTKEKIITVVYQYTYYENEDDGGIKQANELHVVNIHLQLESGVPRIGVLNPPATVLPGYTVGLKAPTVDPGLYEPIGNGWEIYNNLDDAENHRNGLPFDNGNTSVYWYQNEKVWVAFYSKNYLGMTYSNPVPIKVANYHDLDAVMKDKEHHMYVDHPGAIRAPKVYIDNRTCESDANKNELDLLKDFYDLSLSSTAIGGHSPLDENVKGCANMEFILKSNMSPKAYSDWTPIGNSTQCFSGNLHGDGHYIKNLKKSLFGSLCGNVYNLGVMGSFTSAGVADTGDGYVENCWVKSDQTTGFPEGVRAVFGDPSTSGNRQIVNCYYLDTNAYDVTSDETHGIARPMPEKDFYNGTVAYNLNGFYLYKRYNDHETTSGLGYKYYTINADKTLSAPQTGLYSSNPLNIAICSSGYNGEKYVEDRFIDGDFRYAGGTIPESAEERSYTDPTTNETSYYPVWPDDYIYFGQMLTYDWNEARPHEEVPSPIVKSSGRLLGTDQSNRVYRAPAYFGSKDMGVAHFNPVAILASSSNPEAGTPVIEAYPGMTAIDFAGHGDTEYKLGLNGGFFYSPLLDDGGLYSIENVDETHNLLVYAPAKTAENAGDYSNQATFDVLNNYFIEPAYSSCAINDGYGSVAIVTTPVFGHLVQSNLKTTTDHLLVDKQDFNCPISYDLGANYRMWHQRTPDKFVNIVSGNTQGWDNISLPFQVSKVATQQKGEITHFYNYKNVDTGENNTTGHEYWLRKFAGNFKETTTSGVYAADFNLLNPTDTNDPDPYVSKKEDTNTFLWNYYYNKNGRDDKNGEDYKEYYSSSRSYTTYPLEQAGRAYLIGFPGKSYYEFDLSGEWTASNTATPAPAKLDKQTITFASDPAVTIAVSDTELNSGKTVKNGYAYVPNYISKKFTTAGECYVLADDGASYVKNEADGIVSAFRPYIVEVNGGETRGTEAKDNVERVVFEMDDSGDFFAHSDPRNNLNDGTLDIYAKKLKVVVESNLCYVTDVRIVNVAGMTLSSFSIEPGETIETRVESSGVYIVYADNGKYVKKVIVK